MTVEILSHGDSYCSGGFAECICGCRFLYEEDEVKMNAMHNMKYIECPEYKSTIILKKKNKTNKWESFEKK